MKSRLDKTLEDYIRCPVCGHRKLRVHQDWPRTLYTPKFRDPMTACENCGSTYTFSYGWHRTDTQHFFDTNFWLWTVFTFGFALIFLMPLYFLKKFMHAKVYRHPYILVETREENQPWAT